MGYPSTPYQPKVAEAGVKRLYLEFSTTTAGAVGAIARQKGFAQTTPVTRNSAGKYTLALSDTWQALLAATGNVLNATYTAAKGLGMRIVSRTLTGATPNVVVEFVQASGAAADVDDGASVLITLDLKDSTV